MAHFDTFKGGYVTLNVKASTGDGKFSNIQTGYTVVGSVKQNIADTDANAVSYIDTTNNSDRFNISGNDMTVYLLTSEESNNASVANHVYQVVITNDTTNQSDDISKGTIDIADSVPDVK